MRSHCCFLLLSVTGSVLLLAGCPTHRPVSEPPAAAKVAPNGAPTAAPGTESTPPQRHEGRPFDVAPSESLLTILAFRGGTFAKVGHNHVIASHDVSGTFYVPDDIGHSTFELHIPVGQLAIDEPELRAKEGPDFPRDVPDSAKEGTRHNMLSEALLNGAEYPDITLTSQHIDTAASRADVQITIRGQTHVVSVPVTYSLSQTDLTVTGELPLKQTDLGLTPFTAMFGALAVQDEMRVRFRLVAHAAATNKSG